MTHEQPNHCGDRTVFQHDLKDEGDPEPEFNVGIAERLPRKNVAAGVLIRDESGRILFISPTYKPFLDIPGGLTEDEESPLAACYREVREELGVDLQIGRLLLIDWMPTHGVWRDSVQLIFDGGVLNFEQIESIRPAANEVSRLEFFHVDAAKQHLRPSMARRVSLAHRALLDGSTYYAEFGRTP